MNKKGSITVPTAANSVELTEEIIEKWGADAIRDCDGTKLPDALLNKGYDVYSTYFLSRHHNDFAQKYPKEFQQFYFLSEYKTAFGKELKIVVTEGFAKDQVLPNCDVDIARWWEVIDRTTNAVVDPADWTYDAATQEVTIKNCTPFHEYTVTFLAYSIWDSTQMYNHIVNNWGNVPHDLPFDIRFPNSEKYIYETLDRWLKEHPDVDVVRFTTFFYHFTLVFNEHHKKKLVDWTGYNLGVSVEAMEAFHKAKGYWLRPEDLVDEGYYNSQFRVPKKAFLDYMDFLNEFVTGHAKKIVDMVHKAGKKAMMFVGDNWIGIETHSERFKDIGLDFVVTSVGSGVTERILADIKGVPSIEGRFLPYFFPDVFYEGGDPLRELNEGWVSSRRAMMRSPLDRIGFGGYLELTAKFPKFVDRVADICDEFREMKEHIGKQVPFSHIKVGILTSWGKLRSWQAYQIDHAVWKRETYSYLGVMEALSGLPVNVGFIDFDEVKAGGLSEYDVIVNMGDAMTAYSGGEKWLDAEVIAAVRKFVYEGGGFIGVGEPSAISYNGKFFQLSDVLGVEREMGQSLIYERYNTQECEDFATKELSAPADMGEPLSNIYAKPQTQVLQFDNGQVRIATNAYGKGRSYYFTGLKYNAENSRMLYRALLNSCGKSDLLRVWYSENLNTECHYYPQTNSCAVLNNSFEAQETDVYDGNGNKRTVRLAPMEIRWL